MKKALTSLLIVAGLLFVGLGIYYWMKTAGDLPHWLPGHEAGSTHHHLKHGIAAIVIGLGCFIWAWFNSGSKPEVKSGQNKETE